MARGFEMLVRSLGATALLAGCAPVERPDGDAASPSSGRITLALRQSGRVGGFEVTALRVEEDSRCPSEVRCVQAGTVRLAARIAGRARLQPLLTLGRPSRLDSVAWLTLCAVTPYPARPGRIPPSAYRFEFVLSPGSAAPEPRAACPDPALVRRG